MCTEGIWPTGEVLLNTLGLKKCHNGDIKLTVLSIPITGLMLSVPSRDSLENEPWRISERLAKFQSLGEEEWGLKSRMELAR